LKSVNNFYKEEILISNLLIYHSIVQYLDARRRNRGSAIAKTRQIAYSRYNVITTNWIVATRMTLWSSALMSAARRLGHQPRGSNPVADVCQWTWR